MTMVMICYAVDNGNVENFNRYKRNIITIVIYI